MVQVEDLLAARRVAPSVDVGYVGRLADAVDALPCSEGRLKEKNQTKKDMEGENAVLLENRNRSGSGAWDLKGRTKEKENVVLADEVRIRFVESTL